MQTGPREEEESVIADFCHKVDVNWTLLLMCKNPKSAVLNKMLLAE
jgi:hypothetical protein